ncbi:MAG: hypothetical protein K0S67_520 [Nitrososphaeraceae archaeon]|nr:hypothetical protein [Nitrososphaeraceae archaeon]
MYKHQNSSLEIIIAALFIGTILSLAVEYLLHKKQMQQQRVRTLVLTKHRRINVVALHAVSILAQ